MSGDLLEDLKSTVLDLIIDLKNNIFTLEDEKGDLMLVEFFFKRLHPENIMQHVVKYILPWKKKIEKRNEDFFLNNKNIFKGLPEDRIDHYGEIIAESDRVDDDDKIVIWEYFDTIIEIAESYKKRK